MDSEAPDIWSLMLDAETAVQDSEHFQGNADLSGVYTSPEVWMHHKSHMVLVGSTVYCMKK